MKRLRFCVAQERYSLFINTASVLQIHVRRGNRDNF